VEDQMKEGYKPAIQTVDYMTLSSVLMSIFRSDDEQKIEERRKRIVDDNAWPVSKSIILLESKAVLKAVGLHSGLGRSNTSYTTAYGTYQLRDVTYIDISN
jgi:hypothetical protein